MTKIILIIILSFAILSLHVDLKKWKKLIKYFTFLFVIGVVYEFTNHTLVSENVVTLYGASDFEKYASYAQETMRTNGVYASLTLAQAAQEQGLKVPATNNLFGIKADSSWTGKTAALKTEECNSIDCYDTTGVFRVYDSVEGSFTDHGDWLINRFANRREFASATTLEGQLKSLKSNPTAQYATDPNYLCSLANIIARYDLTKYDVGITYSGRGITIVGEHIDNFRIENCASISSNTTSYNALLNYNPGTSYTGNYENGYLFQLLKIKGSTNNLLLNDLQTGYADETISKIYGRVMENAGYSSSGTYDSNIDAVGGIDPGIYSEWKQYDSRWGSIPLGSSATNIKKAGCAATSVAIQISRSGVSLASEFTSILNPGSFVSYLNARGGFTSTGAIHWASASSVAPSFRYVDQVAVNANNVLQTISRYLNSGNYYLIAHLRGSKKNNTNNHWVAVTGVTSNDIYIIDPGRNGNSLEDSYGIHYVDRISIYIVS